MDPRQEMYYNGGNTPHSPDLHDMASFNDNTLVTDQDEYFFGSPKEIPNVAARGANTNDAMNWVSGANAGADSDGRRTRSAEDAGRGYDPRDLSRQPRDRDSRDSRDARNAPPLQLQQPNRGGGNWREARDNGPQGGANTQSQNAAGSGNQMYAPHPQHMLVENDRASAGHYGNHHNAPASQMQSSQNSYESPLPTKEPIEHLVLLANQILSTLREIIMGRYRRGKSLPEIYEHFDRNDKNYFDARDFIIATADLRIETSRRVANIAINMIALDGYDKVCFGEFKVFVLDSDHKLLEMNVQEQLAQMLEQKGREYQTFMVDMFWNEEESLNGSRTPNERPYRQNEFVSKSAFVSSLQRIGLMLTSSELNRLVDRFDMYGNEMCSVPRFVRMVQNSRAWRHGERVLAYQDEAIEEAEYLRQQLSAGDRNGNAANLPKLPEELISMCEYLGIRVLSDANMVWIAADALKAPLPVSWTAQKDANGRTYFYNHLSNQSRLEHPLDPHFRKLRDRYRQGG
jgi:Ca2+-binding EF-hand superfamily protein